MSTHRSKPRDLEISVPGLYGANPNELINIHLPLRLVSPATGRVKLQRSHASQAGERGWEIEGGRERTMLVTIREEVSGKMRAKRSIHLKGRASVAAGGSWSSSCLQGAQY